MFADFLSPRLFDALISVNIAIGLLLALRRFKRDLRQPLPDDAPAWARKNREEGDGGPSV